MDSRWIFHIVFLSLFGLFDSLPDSESIDSISHAFVQTDSELHYFRDTSTKELLNLVKPADIKKEPPGVPLKLVPPKIDFETGQLGIPRRRQVVILNNNDFEVSLKAILSSSQDVYYTFPTNKIIPPHKNTTITVTFLPRHEGHVELSVQIYNSHSTVELQVQGTTKSSEYRLKHEIICILPFKGSLDYPLLLHNPHASRMKVTKIISSDKSVVVSLNEATNDTDLIPYESRKIGDISVVGSEIKNTTVFVMIRAEILPYEEGSVSSDVSLVISIDVEVTERLGIFSTVDVIDFGLIKYGDKSERKVFEGFTNVDNGLEVEQIYVVKNYHPNYGLYMQYASKPPISVPGGGRSDPGKPVPIANVHLDTNYFTLNATQQLHRVTGEIVAESRGGNYNVTVKFKALIATGGISQVMKDSSFYIKLEPPITRVVSLHNEYPFGIGMWDVDLDEDHEDIFNVKLISPVVEVAPNETKPVLVITYLSTPDVPTRINCVVSSNVTAFKVQLLVFEGNIKVDIPYYNQVANKVELGEVTKNEIRSYYFTVANPNPVALALKSLKDPWFGHISLSLLYMGDGNNTKPYSLDPPNVQWHSGMDLYLSASTFMVFNMTVHSNGNLEVPSDLVLRLKTEFEDFVFPLDLKFTNESLKFVDKTIDLGVSFPGKITNKNIRVYSNTEKQVRVLSMSTLTDDPRFSFLVNNSKDMIVPSRSVKTLGDVTFSHGTSCTTDCYCGFTIHSPDGQWFTHGMKLPPNLPEIDSYLYQRLRQKWHAIVDKTVKSKIILDTDRFKSVEVGIKAKLSWPKLFSHPVVHFPLTAVNNFTILNLTLTNPSIHPVIVQLLPLVIYPDAEALLELFKDEFESPLIEPVEMNETLMFSLRDTELFSLKPGSPVPGLREEVEQVINRQVPRFTLSMILKPGMKTRIRVGFLPSDYNLRSSLLLIRNNLTALEPVILYGRGSRVGLEIDGKSPRDIQLIFDILMSHLSDCYNPKRLTHKLGTNLTVKRTFILKNTGESELWIVNISISGTSCSDRGFRVLNCDTFILSPNETRTIDVAYTPDFLMSVNEATLQIYTHMNATPWVFDLVATIAPEMLEICHAALPRPPFEWLMYYACLMALIFCMICISACAYLEGDRCLSGMQHQQIEVMNDLHCDPLLNLQSASEEPYSQVKGFLWRLSNVTSRKNEDKFLWVYQSTDNFFYVLLAKMFNYFIFISEHVWWVIRGDVFNEKHSKEVFDYEKLNTTISLMDDDMNAEKKGYDKPDEAENVKTGKNGVRRRRNANKKKYPEVEIQENNNTEKNKPKKEKAKKQESENNIYTLKTKVAPSVSVQTDSTKSSDSMQWKDEFEIPDMNRFDQSQNNDESNSPPPEWADSVISSSNVNTDFAYYASQAGALFNDEPEETLFNKGDVDEDNNKCHENEVCNTSWLTPEVIEQLVEEYRQKLIELSASNPAAGDISPPLPPIVLELPKEEPVPNVLNGIPPRMDTTYFDNNDSNNVYDQLLQFQQEAQREYDFHRHLMYQGYASGQLDVNFQFPWFIQQQNATQNVEDQSNDNNGEFNAVVGGNEIWHPKSGDIQDWPDYTKFE
ncbi:unnamed protein product [Bursaphelenchus okinawaensis]|uniref:TMEM131_like domain-containing protein n=1 Tax=Bursaphelenchus okinawaensis TaxID=465554 RepID=A0A811KJ62_9BILA|nr:unnamed protein product [Bursaphelenchus okinawaensis]CAG9103899.1 unnamed protein product [Bursaphelenchus okinawaensis]